MSYAVRRLVEQATRSWTYQRRLPAAFGSAPIITTPSAGLKYLFKSMAEIDPSLLRNVKELVRPGDVVWDIGANIGLCAFAAAAIAGRAGKVVAFEPDVWLVQVLRRSNRLQTPDSAPVTIIPAGVASRVALRKFNIAQRARASNSLSGYGNSQAGGVLEEQIIPAFNLDWLLETLPPPNVVKCDVEGAEIEVFEGQLKMLKQIRPLVVCEVGKKTSPGITRIFSESGYKIFDGDKPLAGAPEIDAACWNTVAIPEERSAQYVSP